MGSVGTRYRGQQERSTLSTLTGGQRERAEPTETITVPEAVLVFVISLAGVSETVPGVRRVEGRRGPEYLAPEWTEISLYLGRNRDNRSRSRLRRVYQLTRYLAKARRDDLWRWSLPLARYW